MALTKLFSGTESKSKIRKINPIVSKINRLESDISSLEDSKLADKTEEFKNRYSKGETLDSLLPEVSAVVREVSKRTTGLRHFDVQLIGGVVLNNSGIAEMKTGEGKTLVATLPAYLNAISGEPVHIITVNDYLSRRDAVWMGQIFDFLKLSVGVINGQGESYIYDSGHKELDKKRDEEGAFKIVYEFLRPISRREAYACDIVYGTNNEYAFDFLRDNIEYKESDLRQRGFGFAVIDEVDSILIDEARNPLIISSAVDVPASFYKDFSKFASTFKEETDFTIDEKTRSISLTEAGIKKAEKGFKVENLYIEGAQRSIHHLENALKARALFKKDQHYVVKERQIVIVDEFTGRLQPGRQWSEGLHQAIEAKENLPIQKETRTYASITFQNYFKMYKKLSGMTGTAISSEEEFYKVYGVQVISIPTNREVKRIDHGDFLYQTDTAKLTAVVQKIKEVNEKGQPILIGTSSIESNEKLSKKLKKMKIEHEVLNAKNHEREGEIIANAGRIGKVTVATNLAGRGVDIKLGGAVTSEEKKAEVKKLGGLFVLGTERNESRRVDDQLRGRSGRQGDEGETQFFISLQDSLVRVFGSERIQLMASKMGLPEDQVIKSNIISKSIESAQKRIEGHHFDSRRFSFQYDTVLNKHRKDVYEKRKRILVAEDENVFLEFVSKEEMEKLELSKEENFNNFKLVILRSIDLAWIDHLELMDSAKSSVNLRSYGQKEPIMEYREEAKRLFSGFWDIVNENVKRNLENWGKE